MEKFYYKLHTFGCQMNEYDSQVIASTLNSMGGIPVETDSAADLIILNTCCVRDSADQKIYGRLGQYKAQKRKNPGLIIAVLGCLAQKDKDALQRRFSHVDLVLGTQNLKDLPGVLEEVWKGSSLVLAKEDGADFVTPLHRESSATAYVTISIGCDCFCTYCIVPYVRGRLISRPFQEIVEEVEKLARQGFIEIFLLGQNVNTYGNDLPGRPTFTDLLKRLNRVESIKRIRFTSPHPGDFAPELIDAIGSLDKVCNWVHLPIQSGSDSVLEKMNRKYDTARYEQIVTELRKKVPGITISTDIIVGFPGETEAEFRESLDFIKRMDFDQAFMFAYSIRKGTAAARMGGHHKEETKKERLYQLIKMQNDISRRKNEEQVGAIKEVLVESVSKKDPDRLTGRTEGNKVVNFPGTSELLNKLVKVRLTSAFTWGFLGEIVQK